MFYGVAYRLPQAFLPLLNDHIPVAVAASKLQSLSRFIPQIHPWSPSSRYGTKKERKPPFEYTRLNWATKEIRLVKLLAEESQASSDTPLQCSIQKVSLESEPKYVALSYAWGDNKRSQPLILDGKQTYITASLDAALRQILALKSQDKKLDPHLLWVDAICINQNDEVEKTWQVQQMGRIFRSAYQTIVWLGPGDDSSCLAMEVLQKIGHSIRTGHEMYENPALDLFRLLSQTPEAFGPALNALLLRAWWKRIWVVQEFAVSKEVIFLCGDKTLWWGFGYEALDAIEKYKRLIANTGFVGMIGGREYRRFMISMNPISSTMRLLKIRSALNDMGTTFSLWDLLRLKKDGMKASDNRDLIYAITGIAEDAQEQHLYPDYGKLDRDVFIEVAKTFLAQGKLRALWLCAQPRTLDDLPSWVPDWSSEWKKDHHYFSSDGDYGSSERIFSASGDTQPVVSFSEKDHKPVLHLSGYKFDAVKYVWSPFDIDPVLNSIKSGVRHVHHALADRFRAIQRLQSLADNPIHGISPADAVIRTAITNIELAWGSDIKFTYRRALLASLSQSYGIYLEGEEDLSSADPNNLPDDLPASKFNILFRHNGRRPFVTRKGHLGLGPANLKRGDTVAVILGSEVPFIFSSKKNDYCLVGEAYVDGIMDGEVLEKGLELTTFDVV